MKSVFFWLILNTSIWPYAIAQKINPLNGALIISGSFGEPRLNHFHTGIDFTTRGKTGLSVYAFDAGYVSRIKVSAIGYGKAIYITHPNGLISVYGHLSKFSDVIQSYVTTQQYKQQKSELELYPEANQFIIKKGELIAYSGNSGGSSAPHLHFEVRDAAGESFPLNPLKYNLDLKDTIKPTFRELAIYNLNEPSDMVNPRQYNLTTYQKSYKLQQRNTPDTITIPFNQVGVGVKVHDLANGCDSDGYFGVYRLQMNVDNIKVYEFAMNRLDFNEGRYANCHIDHKQKKKNKEQFYRCYLLPGNKAAIYDAVLNRGIIQLGKGEIKKVEIVSSDYFNNTSNVVFYITTSSNGYVQAIPPIGLLVKHNESKSWGNTRIKLTFDSGTFYDETYLKIDSNKLPSAYSTSYQIHNEYTPLHKSFSLSIKLNNYNTQLPESKFVLVRIKENGSVSAYKSTVANGWVSANPKELGTFYIASDTITPKITPTNFTPGQSTKNKMLTLKITDNLSGIETYNFYVDNQWIVADYDAKNDLISIDISKQLSGEHILKAVVVDAVGNKKINTFKFIKS
ncbi:MAG: peptidoglycan DD-metalloendopeptidase family protein [Bacteroidota bacterium]